MPDPDPLELLPAILDDLDFVIDLERRPDIASFITVWTRERHRQAIESADEMHLVAREAGERVGYVIFAGTTNEHRNAELRRIVVAEPGRGVARRLIPLALDRAFGEIGAHRVWLDLKTTNHRARRAYASAGFRFEGVARDGLRVGDEYEPMEIMAILAGEHPVATRSEPSVVGRDDVEGFIAPDRSEIRELIRPESSAAQHLSFAEATVAPGESTLRHHHVTSEEVYWVVAGEGVVTLGGEEHLVGPGDTSLVPPGTWHSVRNTSARQDLVILCACSPPYRDEDTVLAE